MVRRQQKTKRLQTEQRRKEEMEVRGMLRYLDNGSSNSAQMASGRYFRKCLAQSSYPQLRSVIEDGSLIRRLIAVVGRYDMAELQLDAAWALTNIASGDSADTHRVVNAGAVPALMGLLNADIDGGGRISSELRDQAVWGLSNIAGDCQNCKLTLLRHRFLPRLQTILEETTAAYVEAPNAGGRSLCIHSLRTAAWALSNVCRGRPPAHLHELLASLPTLATILLNPRFANDQQLLPDVCWTVAFLADINSAHAQAILDVPGLPEQLVALLQSNDDKLTAAALRTVGNLVTGDDLQTETVLAIGDGRVVADLMQLLSHEKPAVQREAAWAISNIAAGTEAQIERVLSCPNMIKKLLLVVFDSPEEKLRKEAVWTLCNALSGGSSAQRQRLTHWGLLGTFGRLLYADSLTNAESSRNWGLLDAILSAVDRLLVECGDNESLRRAMQLHFNDYDGIAAIAHLQTHSRSPLIKQQAKQLWDTHLANFKPESNTYETFHFIRR